MGPDRGGIACRISTEGRRPLLGVSEGRRHGNVISCLLTCVSLLSLLLMTSTICSLALSPSVLTLALLSAIGARICELQTLLFNRMNESMHECRTEGTKPREETRLLTEELYGQLHGRRTGRPLLTAPPRKEQSGRLPRAARPQPCGQGLGKNNDCGKESRYV